MAVVNTFAEATASAKSITGVISSAPPLIGVLPSHTSLAGTFSSTPSHYNTSYPQRYDACWQRDQTGAIVGSIFGGIAIGLLIASWIALFILWRRAKARATRAISDLEQKVGRESFNSEDFYYTPDADSSDDKLPLLFHFARDGDERRTPADTVVDGTAQL